MTKTKLFFIMLGLLIMGCASRAPQTEALLADSQWTPRSHVLVDTKFIDQSKGFCGPATLTMALEAQNKNVAIDEVAAQVYTPKSEGTFPADMISASRRNGMVAVAINPVYPLYPMQSLVREITAGNPVVIFENLSVSWAPRWHYALAIGYDLEKQELILHSGHTAFERVDMKYFERSWKLGDYWGLVVLSPDKLSATGSERDHLNAAVGLEQAQKQNEAHIAYQKILERWPRSLVAQIGAANIAFQQGNRIEAVARLKQAVKEHPQSKAAKHNLDVALTGAPPGGPTPEIKD